MAWDIKVPPVDVQQASVLAGFSIASLDKGSGGKLNFTYVDEQGDPFARPRQLTIDPDGVTVTDEKGRVVVWTPPEDAGASFGGMVKFLTDVVTALRDAGALTPRR